MCGVASLLDSLFMYSPACALNHLHYTSETARRATLRHATHHATQRSKVRCGAPTRPLQRRPPWLKLRLHTCTGEWVLPDKGGGKKRREMIYNHLVLSNPMCARGCKDFINLLVGARKVCPTIFCDHWCVSRAQLDRYIRRVREGHCNLAERDESGHQREHRKRDYVITWFLQYAAEVTEKLPDCDQVLLPRMLWVDLYYMFVDDMKAAGYRSGDICGVDYFRNIFNRSEELSHMVMTTYKRNFQKCTDCVKLTAAVTAALKGHDGRAIEKAKAERLQHYILARSDKLHYWQQRWQVLLYSRE